MDDKYALVNDQPIVTDANGFFEVEIPIGNHRLTIYKNGHTFANDGKWPTIDDGLLYYEQDYDAIQFIDETKLKVIGRVVGGTTEADKKAGMELAVNNIGKARLKFTSEAGAGCYTTTVDTDSQTGEYTIELPPLRFVVTDKDGGLSPVLDNPGVFWAPTNPFNVLDLSVFHPLLNLDETVTRNVVAQLTINADAETVIIDIDGDITNTTAEITGLYATVLIQTKEYMVELDSDDGITNTSQTIDDYQEDLHVDYHHQYDLIYRSDAVFTVSAENGDAFKGDKSATFRGKDTKVKINLEKTPFIYPVFTKGKIYSAKIDVYEKYYNLDIDAPLSEDSVPVNDAIAIIDNNIANPSYAELALPGGTGIYTFMAGEPNIIADADNPELGFTQVFNMVIETGGRSFQWEPLSFGDSYYRAYVFGSQTIEGSDFVTQAPDIVTHILRDPPGSNSFAFIEKDTEISHNSSWNLAGNVHGSMQLQTSLGTKFSTGLVFSTATEVKNTLT